MPARLLPLLALLVLLARAGPAGPLDFDGAPPERLLVTWAPEGPEFVSEQAGMINRVQGVALVADTRIRRQLAMLSRTAGPIGWPAELKPDGYLHASRGSVQRLLAFARTSDQIVLVREEGPGTDPRAAHEFGPEPFEPLLNSVGGYPGPFRGSAGDETGRTRVLSPPYRPSPVILDEATVSERLAGGRDTALPPTDRFLPDERFVVRLPDRYDPASPAGLLVWMSAGDDGEPPDLFNAVADRLNIILIGPADAGNRRLATDRYQLGLDAVATARERFHVDDSRIYTSGISGGGRVSSTLAACFPELFAGAVPIVGLSFYQHVPLGDGRFVPAAYRRPRGELWRLLRERRFAPMTGQLDFNQREIRSAVQLMREAGIEVRLFDFEDMAHTLPTEERLAEAVEWVDEPARTRSAQAAREAAETLEGYLAKFGDAEVTSEPQRRILERVAAVGPWSPAAWRACELLGVVEPLTSEP